MRFITVDSDRYNGVYSQALYTAWVGDKPEDIDAGDGICEDFWKNNSLVHGKGNSGFDAVKDLLKNLGNHAWVGWFDIIDLGEGMPENRYQIVNSEKFKSLWPGKVE